MQEHYSNRQVWKELEKGDLKLYAYLLGFVGCLLAAAAVIVPTTTVTICFGLHISNEIFQVAMFLQGIKVSLSQFSEFRWFHGHIFQIH